jgi:hypothetical protein
MSFETDKCVVTRAGQNQRREALASAEVAGGLQELLIQHAEYPHTVADAPGGVGR